MEDWKKAKVTPILKKGKKKDPDNLSPWEGDEDNIPRKHCQAVSNKWKQGDWKYLAYICEKEIMLNQSENLLQ